MEAIAMELLWPLLHFLAFLFSANSVHSHNTLPGLLCVNDFVNNVSCTWSSSEAELGVDCWLLGTKEYLQYDGFTDTDTTHEIKRNCKLTMQDSLGDSVRSCSFVFEKKSHDFTFYERMPSIEVQCNNLTVDRLTDYVPEEHIKMHPPSCPNISSGANETVISWDPGVPLSVFLERFHFQIQIKHHHQTWEEVGPLPTRERALRIPAEGRQAGLYQARVRVQPEHGALGSAVNSYWSDWSPTASWETPPAQGRRGLEQRHDQNNGDTVVSWLLPAGLALCTVFTAVILVVLCRARSSQGLCKATPVPDPSKYFHTVHRGNFKEWLNPQTAPRCYFTVQSFDQNISPVEVVSEDPVPPSSTPSSSSVTAMLHSRPLSGGAAGGVNVSSSSSSSFSNVVLHNRDYFFSAYPSAPAPRSDPPCPGGAPPGPSSNPCPSGAPPGPSSNPCPVYFTYQDDFLAPHNATAAVVHNNTFCLTRCPSPFPALLSSSLSSSSPYEVLLRRGGGGSPASPGPPQSPDSGFGSTEDQADEGQDADEGDEDRAAEFSDDPQEEEKEQWSSGGPLILPLILRVTPLHSSSPPPPPPPPISSPIAAPEPPPKLAAPPLVVPGGGVSGGGGSYVAWPAGGNAAAGSWGSVSVEQQHASTGGGGYLTLKDLHNTYRNKSI